MPLNSSPQATNILGPWIYEKEGEPQAYRFNANSLLTFPDVASVGAGVANTTIQAQIILATYCKISKVAVSVSAIDATAGDMFNIVVGTGSYTQGEIAPNDDSWNNGYPTVFADAGDALFSADVEFNTTNFPDLTTGSGGSAIFNPTNLNAIYPPGTILTLRAVTNASTGSLSDLLVGLCLLVIDPQPTSDDAFPGSTARGAGIGW